MITLFSRFDQQITYDLRFVADICEKQLHLTLSSTNPTEYLLIIFVFTYILSQLVLWIMRAINLKMCKDGKDVIEWYSRRLLQISLFRTNMFKHSVSYYILICPSELVIFLSKINTLIQYFKTPGLSKRFNIFVHCNRNRALQTRITKHLICRRRKTFDRYGA